MILGMQSYGSAGCVVHYYLFILKNEYYNIISFPCIDIFQSHTWRPGDEVVGQYDFTGRSRDDLPFQRGDILVIVRLTSVCFLLFFFLILTSF